MSNFNSRITPLQDAFRNITAKELFTWQRPLASSVTVTMILLLVYIFGYLQYTIITFICRVIQLAFILVGVGVYTKTICLSAEDARSHTSNIVMSLDHIVSDTIERSYRVLVWEVPSISVGVMIGSTVVGLLGTYVSDVMMVTILTIFAFTVPVAYYKNRAVVDRQIDKIKKSIKKSIDNLPIGKKKHI
eukprot:Tbor_TRINITY_DN965_c0_g1::TRINITY_DN965_c0_g1_i1::g.21214::m.21214